MLTIQEKLIRQPISRACLPQNKAQKKLTDILEKLKSISNSYQVFGKFDKRDTKFCSTVEIPTPELREKILSAIVQEGAKDTDIAIAFALNPNLFTDNRSRNLFLTDMIIRTSLEGTSVQESMCKNENLIPGGNSEADFRLRERVAVYIMDSENRDKKSTQWLALNSGLFKNPKYGDYALRLWANHINNMETIIAKNILENLRLQRQKLQRLNVGNGTALDFIPTKKSEINKTPDSVKKIIDRIKHDPKGPRGAALSSKDKLTLMSYSDSLIRMQGKDEKFIFELMQNPGIVSSSSWNTTINKANSYFEDYSDHGFLLGLALNEQKNKIYQFRDALLLLAAKYPYSTFAENVISGLTEFNKKDIKLVSALSNYNPKLRTALMKNSHYRSEITQDQ